MTDDLPVGHYFKRLTVISAMFGDVDWHVERFASLVAEQIAPSREDGERLSRQGAA